MIAKISPLIRLPRATDVFDYFVPVDLRSKIKPGSLVRIPFRSSKVAGVVLSLAKHQETKTFRARPIDIILEDKPILTQEQLQLISQFSKYYFTSMGSVVRLIVPERPERKTKPRQPINNQPPLEFKISSSQLSLLKQEAKKILKAQHIIIQDVSSFVWLLLHLAKHSKASQILVLIPTLEMISAIAKIVQKLCSGNLAVIHSNLSKGAHWNEYQKILSGSTRVILSTRQGVFLPIQPNSQIIFFDATSDDFKQYDQSPRYDARIVAQWVARLTKSKLLFTQSAEMLTQSATSLTLLPCAHNRTMNISMIDMKQEMSQKDFSIISEKTLSRINDTIKQGKKVVVISLREESVKGVSVQSIHELLTKVLKNCKVSRHTNDFDVLLTTPVPLEGLKLSSHARKLGLLVFASIEPLLAIPDYRSSERAYYRLKHWQMLAQELGFSKIILQSYSPDSLAVKAFAKDDFEALRKAELANRKELNYPPFTKLIKLSYRGKDLRAVAQLRGELAQHNLSPPFTDTHKRQSLLIKLSNNDDLSKLTDLGSDWIIDRDPENVL